MFLELVWKFPAVEKIIYPGKIYSFFVVRRSYFEVI